MLAAELRQQLALISIDSMQHYMDYIITQKTRYPTFIGYLVFLFRYNYILTPNTKLYIST